MNKYRTGSKRLTGYDYTCPGKYFITICTKNKIPYFGKIENGEMKLSELGIIARDLWIAIPDHCPNIGLDEFVIMPDHNYPASVNISGKIQKNVSINTSQNLMIDDMYCLSR